MTYYAPRLDSAGVTVPVAWSDPGAWDTGGMVGGHDYSGGHGGGGGGGGGGSN